MGSMLIKFVILVLAVWVLLITFTNSNIRLWQGAAGFIVVIYCAAKIKPGWR